ncbi:hypothetical protein QQP08_002309 [Theobroma cacao]|nr:hypothetical protein QQP08_002309 [Theobroma cacao]
MRDLDEYNPIKKRHVNKSYWWTKFCGLSMLYTTLSPHRQWLPPTKNNRLSIITGGPIFECTKLDRRHGHDVIQPGPTRGTTEAASHLCQTGFPCYTLSKTAVQLSFVMDFCHENSNPNPSYTFFPESFDPMPEFELADYLMLDDCPFEEDTSSQSMGSSEKGMGGANGFSGATSRNTNMQVK